MLLLSASAPISGRYRRSLRRGGRRGTAEPHNDPSVATKLWHMACVTRSDIGEGGNRAGRGAVTRVSRKLHCRAGIVFAAPCSVCVGEWQLLWSTPVD